MDPLNELIRSFREKRVIPFIGAGFSQSCGYPSWQELIEHLLDRFSINIFDIENNIDLLRLAEYLKIISGNEIGPIRVEIEKLFNSQNIDISKSDPHLHLVSLGAPIIYTTNFDSLIEEAYNYAEVPSIPIVTTRDIVRSSNNQTATQIVKFHGSFEHEKTIVLTESDYFRRLEFESPIDIKLRSDIIGRSILFIGYSFSDYNVRYLWFKLRNMMKNVSDFDRPKSFILLAEKDEIMGTLFQNLGIIPIYLSDYSGDDASEQLSDFMERLVNSVHMSPNLSLSIPLIATNNQINNLKISIVNKSSQAIISYSSLLSISNFGNEQLNSLIAGDWLVGGQMLGNWFYCIEELDNESREHVLNFLYTIDKKWGPTVFFDIFIICFLRYPEARDIEIRENWINISSLVNGTRLVPSAEFQILFDAMIWVKFSSNLKSETIFYYLYIISAVFTERLDEIILDPCEYEPSMSSKPPEYFRITPQFVIDYIYTKVQWLPSLDDINENISNLDSMVESIGGTHHRFNDLLSSYSIVNEELVESLLEIS